MKSTQAILVAGLVCLSLSQPVLAASVADQAPFRVATLDANEDLYQAEILLNRLEQQLIPLTSPAADANDFELPDGQNLDALRRLILDSGDNAASIDHGRFLARVYQLRSDYARLGLPVGDWSSWGFDGHTLTGDEATLIARVEERFRQLAALRPADGTQAQARLVSELRDLLAQPAFAASENLSDFRQMYADALLQGYQQRLQQQSLSGVGRQVSQLWISLAGLDPNDSMRIKQLQAEAADILNALTVMGEVPNLPVRIQTDSGSRELSWPELQRELQAIADDPVQYRHMHLAPQ